MRSMDKVLLFLTVFVVAAIAISIRHFVRQVKEKNQNRNRLTGGQSGPELPPLSRASIEELLNKSVSSRAASLFLGPENYNCAQAILHAFQKQLFVQDADIIAARSMGYGKVPGGLCGALYAAISLLNDPDKSKQLTSDFQRSAGSCRCKKILKIKRITCKECVALSAHFLEQHLCLQRR